MSNGESALELIGPTPDFSGDLNIDAALSAAGGEVGPTWLDSLSRFAERALPFMKLGTGLAGIGTGIASTVQAGHQQGILDRAQRASERAQQTAISTAAPSAAAGAALTPAGVQALLGGQLPPALEAQVEQWKNDARARLRQYYAHLGQSDSTSSAQIEDMIEAQAQQLRGQLAQQLLQSGGDETRIALGGASVAGNLAQAEGGTAAGQAGSLQAAIARANQALFDYLGRTG